jgi:hypothetical protein
MAESLLANIHPILLGLLFVILLVIGLFLEAQASHRYHQAWNAALDAYNQALEAEDAVAAKHALARLDQLEAITRVDDHGIWRAW